jgi:shikimate kinase
MTTSGPHLVVIGAPGAGKTRVGKRVARLLKVTFIDTDRRIVAAHGPIATIFAERGEAWFRQVERAEVAKALSEDAVVSLGGGAVLDPATQEQLAHHRVVMLTVSAEAVEKRITGAKRPLLKDGIGAWLTLVESRREIYERLATRSWDTSDLPIDQIAAEIAEWVLEDSASKELP